MVKSAKEDDLGNKRRKLSNDQPKLTFNCQKSDAINSEVKVNKSIKNKNFELPIECTAVDCKLCTLESFIDDQWRQILLEEFSKSYFNSLKNNLHSSMSFYPPLDQIFSFTKFTSFEGIKVVILGQDPYHNPGQAMGLSFSVNKGIKIPPSLRNIYNELKSDIPGFIAPKHGDLTEWAKQGVLLLNDTLTVLKNQPTSHSDFGWKFLTSRILELINLKLKNVVFILWGGHARSKANLINSSDHLILECGHPSPMSVRLFKGCNHFSKANKYLVANGKGPIDWRISE